MQRNLVVAKIFCDYYIYILIQLIVTISFSTSFISHDNLLPIRIHLHQRLKETIPMKINNCFLSDNRDVRNNSLFTENNAIDIPRSIPIKGSTIMEFIDTETHSKKHRYITCNLVYELEMIGFHYTIGTPLDIPIAICYEGSCNENNQYVKKYFIDTDIENNIKLLEMGITAFYQRFGYKNGIEIKHTPRTLTLSGDLTSITGINDWEEILRQREIKLSIKNLIENNNKNIFTIFEKQSQESIYDETNALDTFLKQNLRDKLDIHYWENEDYKINCNESSIENGQVMELFNIPGFRNQHDNNIGLEHVIDDLCSDFVTKINNSDDCNNFLNVEPIALRLTGFQDSYRKVYSVVKLLQPMILVGRKDKSLKNNQCLLLTSKEADDILPKLEKTFKHIIS